MDLLFRPFMHSLVDSCMCLAWGASLQPGASWDNTLTTQLTQPGPSSYF